MRDNLVFLTEDELDKPIYRIFSFERLLEIFTNNQLVLVKPKKWDDPFENFILNSTGVMSDGREFTLGMRDQFYGQCWSLTKESDAMWRIYSHDKDGVKVKTTIRKLFTPLFDLGGHHVKMNGTVYNLSSFVGKVRYESTKNLTEMLSDEDRMRGKLLDQSGHGQASTFYFKRLAFRHENEIRIMYNSHDNFTSNIFPFTINPNEIFDQIVFDPRMSLDDYKMHKLTLKNLGYSKSIIQSGLYKIKQFKIPLGSTF
jgi:hypothetical protein